MGTRNEMDDLFLSSPKQLGFDLGDRKPGGTIQINPDDVRKELIGLLETARAARGKAPWDMRAHRYHQTVFPQMARWLPDEEAADLSRQFSLELERIEQFLAA